MNKFERNYMKIFYILIITLFISNEGYSQEEVWSKLFLERLSFSLAVPMNVVLTTDSKIIFPVVEDGNLLRIYKFNENGEIIGVLNTKESATSISEIVKISETEFALIFNVEIIGVAPIYKIIYFNEVLQITSASILNFPIITNYVELIRFFKIQEELFVTFNDAGSYYLMKLDSNSELVNIYNSSNNVLEDHISIISANNLLIDFSSGQSHTLKCLNLNNGDLIWEKDYGSSNELNLDYIKTIDNQGNIYLARLMRDFVNGEIFDTLELLKINSDDGSIILNTNEIPANNCVLKIEDLQYNEITQEIYFSYSNCNDPGGIILKSFSNNLEPLHSITVDANPDGSFISTERTSQILFRNDGRVILFYRNYKNSEEFDNIYFLSLTNDLLPLYTGEMNIPPKNGSELLTDIKLFGSTNAVIIGNVPDKDPLISWEVTQFFIAMIDLDAILHIYDEHFDTVTLFPNPSNDKLSIISKESFESFQVFDVSGKWINCPHNLFNKTIDISNLKKGVYFLSMKTSSANTISRKFIKL